MDVCFLGGTGFDHIWLNIIIPQKIRSKVDSKFSSLATKEDVANTKEVISKFTSDIIKWMFFFNILQLITTFVLFLLFLK
jgi:hypothetical protein